MVKVMRERGVYLVTTPEGTVSVFRQGYAFQLAERLLRAQGIKSRSITKAVANTF